MTITRHYTISGPGIRFAVISDLQDRFYGNLVEQIRNESPDAILLAGNILNRIDYDEMLVMHRWMTKIYGETTISRLVDKVGNAAHTKYTNREKHSHGIGFLKQISAIAPTFYSLGNFEWSFTEADKQIFDSHGVTVLDNSDTEAEINGKRVLIGGLSTRYDLQWLVRFSGRQGGYKVLLCHHPEQYRSLVEESLIDNFDLIVSGHYHGGQWKIGNRGVYIPRIGLMKKDVAGQFGRLIISAGVVNTSRLPRFGNPCELVIVDAK